MVKTISKPINGFFEEYRWLSNFWEVPVTVTGIQYGSTEAAYQAAKTVDIDERQKFIGLTPGQAKRLGSKIQLRANWNIVKLEIMELVLRAKFMTHKDLQQKLIDTGDCELIEFNTWGDTYWGMTKKHGGKNILGKLLMNIREDLTK